MTCIYKGRKRHCEAIASETEMATSFLSSCDVPVTSPAMPPDAQPPGLPDALRFSSDSQYALQGELMMLVLVLLFSLLLIFIIVLPRLKSARNAESGHTDSTIQSGVSPLYSQSNQ
ncbi:hypothetical protein BT93_H3632 [Corymbia citriodora subsp. variegata]|nr:hypothetical protein BT93_H3632 [Corymbia citriodora subsp. variegata]